MGITGIDVVQESQVDVDTILNLEFGKCKLCLQAPVGTFSSASEVAGKRIVTSFPNLAKSFFEKYDNDNKETSIH
jgi:ATP phosphoribosyltransferase